MSFNQIIDNKFRTKSGNIVLAISPQPYDYEQFELICKNYDGKVIMLNGKLDDSEVGIGSVARERRRNFVIKWENIYWIQPLKNAALLHLYPSEWVLFKKTNEGYDFHQTFLGKPDSETIFESLL